MWRFGCCASSEYSTGALYSAGSGSPSGKNWPFDCKNKKFLFLCQLWIAKYTPLTQQYTPLRLKIYTPDSAIYFLRLPLHGVYAIYDHMRRLWSAHALQYIPDYTRSPGFTGDGLCTNNGYQAVFMLLLLLLVWQATWVHGYTHASVDGNLMFFFIHAVSRVLHPNTQSNQSLSDIPHYQLWINLKGIISEGWWEHFKA